MSADRLADIKARGVGVGGPWEVLDADENEMHAVDHGRGHVISGKAAAKRTLLVP